MFVPMLSAFSSAKKTIPKPRKNQKEKVDAAIMAKIMPILFFLGFCGVIGVVYP